MLYSIIIINMILPCHNLKNQVLVQFVKVEIKSNYRLKTKRHEKNEQNREYPVKIMTFRYRESA